jgi:hypothetical protein
MLRALALLIALLSALLLAVPKAAAEKPSLTGELALELRSFFASAQLPGQEDGMQASLSFEPELRWSVGEGRHRFAVVPFARLDEVDDERSHFDVREAWWQWSRGDWEFQAGLDKVYWGVAESRHLVNIINQDDALEDIDGEDKLGQPLLRLTTRRSWGGLDIYLLPGFRERRFPGPNGRLRGPLPVDEDAATFESGAGKDHVDAALRWSHYIGDWDVGLSWFSGTSRAPTLRLGDSGAELVPHYAQIHQLGVDLQYTKGAWLWKLEGVGRQGHGKTFGAASVGFERTMYQKLGRAGDIGILLEYHHDGRDGEAPSTPFDDDVFVGTRLAFNDGQDTQVLLGAIVDVDDQSTSALAEASRRLGQHFKLELEGRFFLGVHEDDPLAAVRKDDFVAIRVGLHF